MFFFFSSKFIGRKSPFFFVIIPSWRRAPLIKSCSCGCVVICVVLLPKRYELATYNFCQNVFDGEKNNFYECNGTLFGQVSLNFQSHGHLNLPKK